MQSNVFVGVKPNLQDVTNTNFHEISNNFDYVLLPITNNKYKDTVKKQFELFWSNYGDDPSMILKINKPQLQDICISPFKDDSNSVSYIGLLSSWLELENPDPLVREMTYQVLLNECNYAKFIGINKLIMAPPRDLNNLQYYAQILLKLLEKLEPSSILSISLPLCEDSDPLATWELWNSIRKLCNYHPSLTISLALPRVKTPNYVLNRWLVEPVSCLLVSSSIFATNQYNYPVLHKFNQILINKFQEVNGNSQVKSSDLCIILHGMEKYAKYIKGGQTSYLEYMNYLLKKGDKLIISQNLKDPSIAPNGDINSNGSNSNHILNYANPQLMSPLQPHAQDLSNSVYSIFEKDSIKYELYEDAIKKALEDLSMIASKSKKLNILVAGAGRGPLVDKVMSILEALNLLNKTEVFAIEKNPQAYLYLQKRNFEYWNNQVTLINKDMRKWDNNNIKIDLCISELLGSFGCNELASECLLPIERNNCKRTTVFIPASYSSYVAPISSPLLHQKLHEVEKNGHKGAMESPWVMHNIPYQVLSTKVNEVFSFEHPLKQQFTQIKTNEFKIKHRSEIHGIVGFFKAHLYGDTHISILPNNTLIKHNDGHEEKEVRNYAISSWSPMVFPLNTPLTVTDDTELSVLVSRNNDRSKVWYEWCAESFIYFMVSTKSGKNNSIIEDPKPKEEVTNEIDSTIDENGFLPTFENGWQSVNDIHGLQNADNKLQETPTPMFNLRTPPQHSEQVPLQSQSQSQSQQNYKKQHHHVQVATEQDIHIRVKTGSSYLHNINGTFSSVPLQ